MKVFFLFSPLSWGHGPLDKPAPLDRHLNSYGSVSIAIFTNANLPCMPSRRSDRMACLTRGATHVWQETAQSGSMDRRHREAVMYVFKRYHKHNSPTTIISIIIISSSCSSTSPFPTPPPPPPPPPYQTPPPLLSFHILTSSSKAADSSSA